MIRIEPIPTPEEAAAIAAVLTRLSGKAATTRPSNEPPVARWDQRMRILGGDRKPGWGSWWR
ncbi:MAG: acyl-CoA carboxylase subunit epsilon [Candidatus Sericytochromatia bacterium]|nr:acyl-CoA carboxylase subunit epsilon [Candidatus Sericytochromatia bacterium]